MLRRRTLELHPALLALGLLGGIVALTGAYWDDAWHTTRGRDTFLAAPHLAIYGGVSLIGAVASLWLAGLVWSRGLWAVRERPAALLAAIAVAATLASAPIDNAWHVAFGRDAVLWSPPHLLGIVGTFVLAAALLVEARGRPRLRVACGALLIAAATFAVAEYETDVPQFSEALYLPTLAVAAVLALGLIELVVPASRWAATKAAVAHAGFMGLVALILAVLDYPTPAAPIVIGASVALDLTRGRPVALRASAVMLGLMLAAALRKVAGGAVTLEASELALGAALGLAGATLLLLLARVARFPGAFVTVAVLALLLPPGAIAHDPGQGETAGGARISVASSGLDVSLRGELRPCQTIVSAAIVLRREGRAIERPLRHRGCAFDGRATADESGRWFAYAKLDTEDGVVESWLPIGVGRGERAAVSDERRFAYQPPSASATPLKAIAGAALVLIALSLVAATFVVARRATANVSAPQ